MVLSGAVVGCLARGWCLAFRRQFSISSCFCDTITMHPTAFWPCRHSRRAARSPPRLSGASWRRGRRTNGLLPSGLVRIDRRGGNATARWRIRTFAAVRSRRVCARGAANQQKSIRRQNHKFLVVSDKAELRGIPERGVGRPNPQIRT